MNLVVECTTMSKPSVRGRCRQGDMKVLSQTEIRLWVRQICATASRSVISIIGLVGVST